MEGDPHAPGGGTSAADTVPGTTATTATVAVGGQIEGTIDNASDHDWYQVSLETGKTYTFSTVFSIDIGDTVLTLRNSTGAFITDNDDANFENSIYLSEITFTATSTGTYFLDVEGFDGAVGAFYLSVTRPLSDSVGGSAATSSAITLGSTINCTLEQTGDHDWYAVQLTAGQTYQFVTSAGVSGNVDTALMLRDASGTLLAFNDDSTWPFSKVRFVAPSTGTYYIDVGGWADDVTGSFQLTAEVAPPLQLYTYDQIAFQLTNTYWGGSSQRFNVQAGGTLTVDVTQLTADGQFLAREALKLWSDATGITFNEVSSGGQISFDDNQAGAFSTSSMTGAFITHSDVNVSTQWLVDSGTGLRSYSLQTYVHEIGHALGLGHGGPYNNNASYNADATYLNDSWATTVMSYFDQSENTYFQGQGFSRAYAQSPMIADIIAANNLYGTPTTTRTGNTFYGFTNTSGRDIFGAAVGQTLVALTIVDHGGTDMLDYSGYSSNQRINLNPETFSNIGGGIGNLSIARGTVIENAKGGSGADVLIGNSVGNLLNGGGGIDQLYGGGGDDIYVADLQGDLVFENVGEGTDMIQSAANFYLYANVENLMLTGSDNLFGVGNELDNNLSGNAGENLLIGWGGVDTIFGGAARDSIFGVEGNDSLHGQAGIDYIAGGNGNDTIFGGTDPDEIYGEAGDDAIHGGDLFNGDSFDTDIMVGGDGNDTIYGNSGLGDFDFMYGNAGNDTFYVDTPNDLVFEQSGEGTDTVYADVNGAGFYLYANIENLTLLGSTPFGVGNGSNNTLIGNAIGNYLLGDAGNDLLNGMNGNDVLFGEAGNDTFKFDQGTGADVIGDFVIGQDKIDVSAYGLTFSQLQSLFVQNGNVGAIQMVNGDVIVLHNVTMNQLSASDFILASSAEAPKALPSAESLAGFAEPNFADDTLLAWHHAGLAIA